MQLTDQLHEKECPGRVVQLFEFQGPYWETTASGPEGNREHMSLTPDPRTILVAAQSIWVAHTFVFIHIQGLLPSKITYLGDIWLSPDARELVKFDPYTGEDLAEREQREAEQNNQQPASKGSDN